MIVSLVGRTISGSSSLPAGRKPPSGSGSRRWWVTTAHFLGKPLDVLSFLLKKAHGDEQGEISILVPCRLEHVIQRPLHILPQSITPRLDHHTASDRTVFGQVRGADHLLVPFRVVLSTGGTDRILGSFCHRKVLPLVGDNLGKHGTQPTYEIGFAAKMQRQGTITSCDPISPDCADLGCTI